VLWDLYYQGLKPFADKGFFTLPMLPEFASNNAHMFYLVCNSLEERSKFIGYLRSNDISSVFHYLSLHNSPYYTDKHDGRELVNCDMFADCLVRLPMFFELEQKESDFIIEKVKEFFK
jgi:dTDP-4-amino-4,6-dideoxygalactose transaminase